MVVQHNISAQNANEAMRKNVAGLKKSTEKLSTGYSINRAADNAAGLAISEKMRSQIRGLTQATANSNDAISLIQTAEGGLQETEDILQRMRELSVQSANGTYTDDDREQIQYEVDALKEEIDRISQATEFNEMKLLDGSLSGTGSTTEYGPRYGATITAGGAEAGGFATGTVITANISGVEVLMTTSASGKGGENAAWDAAGKKLTINLVAGQSYTQADFDKLIEGANRQKDGQTANLPEVSVKLANGIQAAVNSSDNSFKTVGGVRATATAALVSALVSGVSTEGYADAIRFTSNSYGEDTRKIEIAFDVAAGKEGVTASSVNADEETDYKRNGTYTLHLATGTEYSANDIEKLLAKEGLDYSVELYDNDKNAPDGDVKLYANTAVTGIMATLGAEISGAGVYKDAITSTGEGLTFQIGANGVEDQRLTVNVDDMSAGALGVDGINVSKQDSANDAINKIDDAIKAVSTQRAKLGAVQNRLEHTVNSLNTANENLSAAESQIRDTDMATEMIKYTKSNILQQASQSMLAQANQQPQGVLQLLG
ncbi:MAG: flagellar hook protein [Ruminiclostridium sp.]|nr:flagellar hook protein [Ruminiclostridium sp.]